MSSTTTTPQDQGALPGPSNKYIFDEFAGRKGKRLLISITQKILPAALWRTWLSAEGLQPDGKELYAGTYRISLETRVKDHKIAIDLKKLKDMKLLKTSAKIRMVNGKRAPVEVKDFSRLYALAHEFYLWTQSDDYIPPDYELLPLIKADPKLCKKLERFDCYRRVLYNRKPGRKPKCQMQEQTEQNVNTDLNESAPQADLQQQERNTYFNIHDAYRSDCNDCNSSIENSNSKSTLAESLLNNSISNFEKERVRTLFHFLTDEQLTKLVSDLSPDQLKALVVAGYKQPYNDFSDSHGLQTNQPDEHDYTTDEAEKQTYNQPPSNSYPQVFEEMGAEQVSDDITQTYAESIGERPGSGQFEYASSIEIRGRDGRAMTAREMEQEVRAEQAILQARQRSDVRQAKQETAEIVRRVVEGSGLQVKPQKAEQKKQSKKCWTPEQKEEHARREAYRNSLPELPANSMRLFVRIGQEFLDQEPRSSETTAREIWMQLHEAGMPENEFYELLMDFRATALKASIRKKVDKKIHRMPYFMACMRKELPAMVSNVQRRESARPVDDQATETTSPGQKDQDEPECNLSTDFINSLGYYPQYDELEITEDSSTEPTVTSAAAASFDDQGWPENNDEEVSKGIMSDDRYNVYEQINNATMSKRRHIIQINDTPDDEDEDYKLIQRNNLRKNKSAGARHRMMAQKAIEKLRETTTVEPSVRVMLTTCTECDGQVFYMHEGKRYCARCHPAQQWDAHSRGLILKMLNSIPNIEQVEVMIKQEK